jgi:DNA-binding GntR family transcriptional regulator
MKQSTIQSRTYDKLREKIIKMELKPGKKIIISELMETLGVGRTPLRESLKQLQRQNLIYTIPQSGTFISKIDMVQAMQSRFVRECIEKEIMVELSAKYTEKNIEDLKKILDKQKSEFEQKDISEYHDLDSLFHETCYKIVNKGKIWSWINTYNTHLDRFRWLHLESETFDYNLILKEHEALLEAVIEKNIDEVSYLTINHIRFMLKEQGHILNAHPDYFTEESIKMVNSSLE